MFPCIHNGTDFSNLIFDQTISINLPPSPFSFFLRTPPRGSHVSGPHRPRPLVMDTFDGSLPQYFHPLTLSLNYPSRSRPVVSVKFRPPPSFSLRYIPHRPFLPLYLILFSPLFTSLYTYLFNILAVPHY